MQQKNLTIVYHCAMINVKRKTGDFEKMKRALDICKKYWLGEICTLALIAVVMALNYAIFVFPYYSPNINF